KVDREMHPQKKGRLEPDVLKASLLFCPIATEFFPDGTLTAREVFEVISSHEVDHLFPLFTVTYDIAFKGRDPADLVRVFETREVRPHKTAEECNILVLPPLMANARRRIGRLQSIVDHERFKEQEKKIVKEYEKRYTEIEVAAETAKTADDFTPVAPAAEECRARK
ncbi:glycerol-3-phosphate dehydrogenase, partial [Toxoplasma gondii p89]